MNEILQKTVDGINAVDVAIWGWPMIILLLGTHIFMTICTGGIQRKIGTAIQAVGDPGPGCGR